MYAVTDGLSGLDATWDTPGSGHNFLVHNMCRLPGSDGTWMVVRGGMGTVTRTIAGLARDAGATIVTGRAVTSIEISDGAVRGIVLDDSEVVATQNVVGATDPFRLRQLVGASNLPAAINDKLDSWKHYGTTMKVNLALTDLPTFSCLPERRGQHGATIHLLPQDDVLASLKSTYAEVKAGKLADFPTIEWYIHTTVDPSLQDAGGHHSSALFVEWVPYEIAGSSWAAERAGYVEKLLGICDQFAPGTSDLVADTFALAPPDIEAHFGMTRGHIHHVDNAVAFADRMPYFTGVSGLYAGGAGCHPAGSVIGAAGHNVGDARTHRPGPQPADGVRQYGRMTAYWISIYPEVIDQEKFAAYAKLSKPALEAAGGTFIARGVPELVYEDGKMTRVVLIEFASVEAARAAHESAAYQEALAALDGGAVRDLRIVPGD